MSDPSFACGLWQVTTQAHMGPSLKSWTLILVGPLQFRIFSVGGKKKEEPCSSSSEEYCVET